VRPGRKEILSEAIDNYWGLMAQYGQKVARSFLPKGSPMAKSRKDKRPEGEVTRVAIEPALYRRLGVVAASPGMKPSECTHLYPSTVTRRGKQTANTP